MLILQNDKKLKRAEQMKVNRLKPLMTNIGVIGVGHKSNCPQFDGLLDELKKKLQIFSDLVESNGVETINLGISDCAETVYQLVPKLKSANLDLLFVDMVTYATSSSIGDFLDVESAIISKI